MSIQFSQGKLQEEERKTILQQVQCHMQKVAQEAVREVVTEMMEAEVTAKLGRGKGRCGRAKSESSTGNANSVGTVMPISSLGMVTLRMAKDQRLLTPRRSRCPEHVWRSHGSLGQCSGSVKSRAGPTNPGVPLWAVPCPLLLSCPVQRDSWPIAWTFGSWRVTTPASCDACSWERTLTSGGFSWKMIPKRANNRLPIIKLALRSELPFIPHVAQYTNGAPI